jgi:membrane dipeptidase
MIDNFDTDADRSGPRTQCSTRRDFLNKLLIATPLAATLSGVLSSLRRETSLLAEAAELVKEAITIDLHCHPNQPGTANFPAVDPNLSANMKTGGVDAGLFAVRGDLGTIRREPSGRYFEYRKAASGELFKKSQEQLDQIEIASKAGELLIARSPAEIIEAKKRGAPCALCAIEGSDPLEGDPARAQFFYDRGVRILQLVHYRINELGDIQTEKPRHNGLTSFGREVVKEMNRLGMVIDTAHGSAETVNGVITESRHPVIFSHTGVKALRNVSRHIDDATIQTIAKKDGIIGVWPLRRRGDTLETFLRDIDYIKNLAGADHVGIGTDLYGLRSDTFIPTHKEFAIIPAALLKRGYAETEVEKIIGANFMRLFRQIAQDR